MRHLFIDTNVLIDYLAGREPFADDAAQLFALAEKGQLKMYAASISISNSYYVISRHYRTLNVRALLADLMPWLTITEVSATVIEQALSSTFRDFEDGLQYYSAAATPAIEAIVTRNVKDFSTSLLPVLEPPMAKALFEQSSE